ncbi:MAG TPA: protein kinase [Pyrinomonadaceae bacterium]|nr:protein kinase [Pyrinomonadaceae bacterium]
MKSSNWERMQEIYAEAVVLSNSERSSYVANACAGNLELRREIEELLKAGDSLGDFLSSPIIRLTQSSESFEGTTIDGRYVVERSLGHTSMSQVYLARAENLQQKEVVIKILSEAAFEDANAKQRFERELKTLLQLDHPNVVKVQDSGTLPDGRSYLVMPYIDGETLRSQISNEGMDLERAASILKQIGAALDHVHENDILHRDLKPENIMLKRGTESVVLIDFGIAQARDSVVAPNPANDTLIGTLLYMSPEQLSRRPMMAASDIYSTGVLAYEMVTGRRPFNPGSPAHLVALQREGPSVRPRQLRESLSLKADRTIIRALSFEPKARYKTAGEFADRLAEALLAESLLEGHTTPLKVSKWVKVGGALMLLALLAFGVGMYFIGDGPPLPNRSFTYFLTVQRMFDGKEYGELFQSNGEDDTFEKGDQFRLSVTSPISGYLYIFNEGPADTSDTSFVMLYPSKAINGGSSAAGSNQPIESGWITFRGPAGDENFWIVWSLRPVGELEAAKAEALKHARGGLTGESLVAVKEFLRTKQAEFKATVFHYKGNQTAVARGKTDMLIALAQIKHR